MIETGLGTIIRIGSKTFEIACSDVVNDKNSIFWTFDEAMEFNELFCDTDWRIPTAIEWQAIISAIAVNKQLVRLTADDLKPLGFEKNGRAYIYDHLFNKTNYDSGMWWSTTYKKFDQYENITLAKTLLIEKDEVRIADAETSLMAAAIRLIREI